MITRSYHLMFWKKNIFRAELERKTAAAGCVHKGFNNIPKIPIFFAAGGRSAAAAVFFSPCCARSVSMPTSSHFPSFGGNLIRYELCFLTLYTIIFSIFLPFFLVSLRSLPSQCWYHTTEYTWMAQPAGAVGNEGMIQNWYCLCFSVEIAENYSGKCLPLNVKKKRGEESEKNVEESNGEKRPSWLLCVLSCVLCRRLEMLIKFFFFLQFFCRAIFRYNGVRFSISRILDIGVIAIPPSILLVCRERFQRFSGLLEEEEEINVLDTKFRKTHFHRIDVWLCGAGELSLAVAIEELERSFLIKNEFSFSNIIKPFLSRLTLSAWVRQRSKLKFHHRITSTSWAKASLVFRERCNLRVNVNLKLLQHRSC